MEVAEGDLVVVVDVVGDLVDVVGVEGSEEVEEEVDLEVSYHC